MDDSLKSVWANRSKTQGHGQGAKTTVGGGTDGVDNVWSLSNRKTLKVQFVRVSSNEGPDLRPVGTRTWVDFPFKRCDERIRLCSFARLRLRRSEILHGRSAPRICQGTATTANRFDASLPSSWWSRFVFLSC